MIQREYMMSNANMQKNKRRKNTRRITLGHEIRIVEKDLEISITTVKGITIRIIITIDNSYKNGHKNTCFIY